MCHMCHVCHACHVCPYIKCAMCLVGPLTLLHQPYSTILVLWSQHTPKLSTADAVCSSSKHAPALMPKLFHSH